MQDNVCAIEFPASFLYFFSSQMLCLTLRKCGRIGEDEARKEKGYGWLNRINGSWNGKKWLLQIPLKNSVKMFTELPKRSSCSFFYYKTNVEALPHDSVQIVISRSEEKKRLQAISHCNSAHFPCMGDSCQRNPDGYKWTDGPERHMGGRWSLKDGGQYHL